ncbi:MAG: insulinase family protein, partial [Mucinivorans sp.]
QFPTLFNNSIYSKRNVIGNEEVIKNFAYDDLRSFYKKWYRPDMQAFVIVGDFSVDTMEMKLKATMADIKAATVKTPKDEVVIADNDEPLINISSDPELSATTTQIIFRYKPLEAKYKNCMLAQKQDVVTDLINMMLGQRLDEISKQENAPFLGAGASYFNFIAPFDAFFIAAGNKDGEALRGLEAIYTELVRMQRGGFVSSELERAKLNIITDAESTYKNRNDKRNGQFIQEYMDNFTDNTPYPSEQTRLEITKNMVENTTLAEVNAMAAKLVSDRNCAILLSSPKKDGITEPTQGEVMDVIAKVKNSKIDIYVDQVNNEPLISDSLKGSKITATDKGQFGSTVWTLANGVRVVLKKTELQADQVIMNSQQWGGTSLITDQSELFSIDTYSSFENYAGLSKFTSTELDKILTGKIAGVSPYFGTTTQGFSGSCAPKDIQTMLELTYLYMVHPRFDAKDLEIVKNNMRTMIPNLKKDPDYLFSEKLQDILYKDSKRTMKLEIAELDKITIKAMQKAYTMLLSNANGMVFTFVGNFDEQAL